jgi:hypothetical protein
VSQHEQYIHSLGGKVLELQETLEQLYEGAARARRLKRHVCVVGTTLLQDCTAKALLLDAAIKELLHC